MVRCLRLTVLAPAFALFAGLAAACDSDTQTSPTPATVSQGSVTASPTVIGLAGATPFTFTATGFTSSNGEPLTYAWDFGDRTQATGGATVTHTYMFDWYVFKVTVTATAPGGASARAEYNGVRVKALGGLYGIRDVAGRFVVTRTSLAHNDAALHGDDSTPNCRYDVVGSVSPPRMVFLTYTRPPGDCQGRDLPESFTFSGVAADEVLDTFSGTLTPGGPATLVKCPYPVGCS
jgi:hypothetical protein